MATITTASHGRTNAAGNRKLAYHVTMNDGRHLVKIGVKAAMELALTEGRVALVGCSDCEEAGYFGSVAQARFFFRNHVCQGLPVFQAMLRAERAVNPAVMA